MVTTTHALIFSCDLFGISTHDCLCLSWVVIGFPIVWAMCLCSAAFANDLDAIFLWSTTFFNVVETILLCIFAIAENLDTLFLYAAALTYDLVSTAFCSAFLYIFAFCSALLAIFSCNSTLCIMAFAIALCTFALCWAILAIRVCSITLGLTTFIGALEIGFFEV